MLEVSKECMPSNPALMAEEEGMKLVFGFNITDEANSKMFCHTNSGDSILGGKERVE